MVRPVLAALTFAACAAALAPSCNASVVEACLDGPCPSENGGMGGTGARGTSSTAKGAGGGADACPPTPQTGDIPCDVFTVIHLNCNPCHQNPPKNGAPFPLLDYSDTQQLFEPGKLIFQQMYDQTRPDACPRMPLGGMLSPPTSRR